MTLIVLTGPLNSNPTNQTSYFDNKSTDSINHNSADDNFDFFFFFFFISEKIILFSQKNKDKNFRMPSATYIFGTSRIKTFPTGKNLSLNCYV